MRTWTAPLVQLDLQVLFLNFFLMLFTVLAFCGSDKVMELP